MTDGSHSVNHTGNLSSGRNRFSTHFITIFHLQHFHMNICVFHSSYSKRQHYTWHTMARRELCFDLFIPPVPQLPHTYLCSSNNSISKPRFYSCRNYEQSIFITYIFTTLLHDSPPCPYLINFDLRHEVSLWIPRNALDYLFGLKCDTTKTERHWLST